MDAIIQELENCKAHANNAGTLSQESSERYLDLLITSLFSQDAVERDDKLLLIGLGHLSDMASVETWKQRLSPDLINKIYDLIISQQSDDLATTQASTSILTKLSQICLSNSPEVEALLEHLCISLQTNNNILALLHFLLQKYNKNMMICFKIVNYLSLHIECLVKWCSRGEKTAIQIATATNIALKDIGILDEIDVILKSQKRESSIINAVDAFIKSFKRLKTCLVELDPIEYEIETVQQVKALIHQLFDVYEVTKERFSKSNKECENLAGLTIIEILNLRFALIQNDLTFKKQFTEQLMFQETPLPLLKSISGISDIIWKYLDMSNDQIETKPYKKHFILHFKEIIISLLNMLAKMWEISKSGTLGDLESLLGLVRILILKVDKICQTEEDSFLELFSEICETSSYEDLRQLQVAQWRTKQYQDWADDISSFDEILRNQVQEFVRYQRLLLMQKGTWVYSENPIEAKDKLPKVSFIALSDNQMNFLIREFKHKVETSPSVNDNEIECIDRSALLNNKTLVIPLKNIANIQSRQIELDRKIPEGARLINILQTTIYTEVTIFERNGKILSVFYLESAKSFYTWLDGLQLLSQNKNAKLSSETVEQIDILIELRRNIQLAALNDKFKDEQSVESFSEEEDDELYYNQDTLKLLTENLYYE